MAYTEIDDPTAFFQVKTYTGNGADDHVITLDGNTNMQPDLLWFKGRSAPDSGSSAHRLIDSVRGITNLLASNSSDQEFQESGDGISSINSNGFTLQINSQNDYNTNDKTYVSWNWKAGGSAPAITYSVKVVSDSGNKYRFDDFGTSAVTLDLQEGGTYTFDQSDSSNSGHPLRFSTTSNGSHGGGSEYTTGVTVTGTPGNAGAKTVITVGSGVATLYYYCTQHSAMGGQANTNSAHGSSNFSGSIQTNVSASTTAGFSIVSYTSNGTSSQTVGHNLGGVPEMIISKNRDSTSSSYNYWTVYHHSNATANDKRLRLDTTDAVASTNEWGDTDPTSTVYSIHTSGDGTTNHGSDKIISYCFRSIKGYSRFGTYKGGGSNTPFIYTGFKPAFIITKRTDSSTGSYWVMYDNKRDTFNPLDRYLYAYSTTDENTGTNLDFLSNGFRPSVSNVIHNASGGTYVYMCFAENPFTTSTGIPTTAR